ncbi:MAG TPA: sulfatase [Thermoanaerobaculia bacterium]|nr:sulfatase [Thermoanaerobaculia bacterium]HUM29954.1 sulfatase [Thermoanaerobaculia bacterium]HXK68179.1 sulfatase [Thermoanaerobaculia bacterium]
MAYRKSPGKFLPHIPVLLTGTLIFFFGLLDFPFSYILRSLRHGHSFLAAWTFQTSSMTLLDTLKLAILLVIFHSVLMLLLSRYREKADSKIGFFLLSLGCAALHTLFFAALAWKYILHGGRLSFTWILYLIPAIMLVSTLACTATRAGTRTRTAGYFILGPVCAWLILVGFAWLVSSRVTPSYNVVFLVPDALRYDHAETLDRFLVGEEGFLRYPKCYVASSWTRPSVISLLSGVYPHEHGADRTQSLPYPDVVTLQEILRNRGYATWCFTANPLIETFLSETTETTIYRQNAPAGEMVKSALIKLDRVEQPFFFYLHFMEPHTPYTYSDPGCKRLLGPYPDARLRQIDHLSKKEAGPVIDCMRKAYREESERVNHAVVEMVAALKERNILDNTIVLVMSDHGQELWDHGHFDHGHAMWEEVIHVPCFLHIPSDRRNLFPDTLDFSPRSSIDILPTILELTGIQSTQPFPGLSLLTPSPANRFLFVESGLYGQEIQAVIGKEMKYIFYTDEIFSNFPYDRKEPHPFLNHAPELFFLDQDPLEKVNQAVSAPEITDRMEKERIRFLHTSIYRPGEKDTTLSQEEIQKLKSIGYIQ